MFLGYFVLICLHHNFRRQLFLPKHGSTNYQEEFSLWINVLWAFSNIFRGRFMFIWVQGTNIVSHHTLYNRTYHDIITMDCHILKIASCLVFHLAGRMDFVPYLYDWGYPYLSCILVHVGISGLYFVCNWISSLTLNRNLNDKIAYCVLHLRRI